MSAHYLGEYIIEWRTKNGLFLLELNWQCIS